MTKQIKLKPWHLPAILIVLCLVFGAAALWAPGGTLIIVILWLAFGIATLALAVLVSVRWDLSDGKIGNHVQSVCAAFTILAVFIAGGVYFLEGSDKVRLSYRILTDVIRPDTSARSEKVLLAIRVPIENRGLRSLDIECISIDILRPGPAGQVLARSGATEEMQMFQLGDRIPYHGQNIDACLREAAARGDPVRPLFMWPRLSLRPNEVDDLYFEMPVRCDYPFVRIILKIRVRPRDVDMYETKTIVPLLERCSDALSENMTKVTPVVGNLNGRAGNTVAPPPSTTRSQPIAPGSADTHQTVR